MFITADLPPMAAEIRQAEQQGKLYGVFTCQPVSTWQKYCQSRGFKSVSWV
jgi:hypothetical protein